MAAALSLPVPASPRFSQTPGALLWLHDVHPKFLTPQKWIGAHYPGNLLYQLLSGGDVIYTSLPYSAPGLGEFYGVVSDQMFDEVKIINDSGLLSIDNIYFGVPAPGAVSVFGLWFVGGRRRR